MKLWGVRLRFDDCEKVLVLGSRIQAEFYITMIPQLMVWENVEVAGCRSARIVPVQ